MNIHADQFALHELDARKAAHLIWDNSSDAHQIIDPQSSAFANTLVVELARCLRSTPGVLKKMMDGAANAAEGLNVAQFQGIIECTQNADDVRATEVRFAVRNQHDVRQLLIVHNGEPVTCHHVLSMALSFLTTKSDRDDQRGRWGVGLKTLKRIGKAIAVHSAQYHFLADQQSFGLIDAEAPLPGFYDPTRDTLMMVDLKEGVDEGELADWFEEWNDDGLIFLSTVTSFRFCKITGEILSERKLRVSEWEEVKFGRHDPAIVSIVARRAQSSDDAWTIWHATLTVPNNLHPSHKVRSPTTGITIAVSDDPDTGNLYIGFKTRVPVSLSFSIDAQFDPSTDRESLIVNDWNKWLIKQCGHVVSAIAIGLLASAPRSAWALIPRAAEMVGNPGEGRINENFTRAFSDARDEIREHAAIALGDTHVSFSRIAYEEAHLSSVLDTTDIEALSSGKSALPLSLRDADGRWRYIVEELKTSTAVGTTAFLQGFRQGLFTHKPPDWWVAAGKIITEHFPVMDGRVDDKIPRPFDCPFLLSVDLQPASCYEQGRTARPLIVDASTSAFERRWDLLQRLHPAYREAGQGGEVLRWLEQHAAYAVTVTPAIELAAFAEKYAGSPVEVEDEALRDIRDLFDNVPHEVAARLGPVVGRALLIDGFVFVGKKQQKKKVSPPQAYLSKAFEKEHSNWSQAAGDTPGIAWVALRYEEELKSGTRQNRRRNAEGVPSRGARRFLMLLGVESSPRILQSGQVRGGQGTRERELAAMGAELVKDELICPDFDCVITSLAQASKKEVKLRSPALLRAISRNWERLYAPWQTVISQHETWKYFHDRRPITARWLIMMREAPWVTRASGELVAPSNAVVKSAETQSLYSPGSFAFGVELGDVDKHMATTLGLIMSIRVSDLLKRLRALRQSLETVDEASVMQVYRAISRQCPKTANVNWQTTIGDLTALELRHAFNEFGGLIYNGQGRWTTPEKVLRGKDIFHSPERFVPPGSTFANLWSVLNVREPTLDDCIEHWKRLADGPYDKHAIESLIDVCRYMEPLLEHVERRQKERMKTLPLHCGGRWQTIRPIYYVENMELRSELAGKLSQLCLWMPPCPMREMPRLLSTLGLIQTQPELKVVDGRAAALTRGESLRTRFMCAVDTLSDELARHNQAIRAQMSLGWDQLKGIPLYVYEQPIAVRCADGAIPGLPVAVKIKSLMASDPLELHVFEDALPEREHGGDAIASLFPAESQRSISAEWVVAWQQSRDVQPEGIRLASDEARAQALKEQADRINAAKKDKIKVTPPKSRTAGASVKPRTLKSNVGRVSGAKVNPGMPPKPLNSNTGRKLRGTAPGFRNGGNSSQIAPCDYTNADLEQRGWEILSQVLQNSEKEELVDFRNRHGVGADGVINWRLFVEMKASGRGMQSSIEMSNPEYERAKERGQDFILALVYGLETGEKGEVCLIFDPTNQVAVRPVNGVRLSGLAGAPSVTIEFDGLDDGEIDGACEPKHDSGEAAPA